MKPVFRKQMGQNVMGAPGKVGRTGGVSSPKRSLHVAGVFGFLGFLVIAIVLALGPKSGQKAGKGCWVDILPHVHSGLVTGCAVSSSETVVRVNEEKWSGTEDTTKEMLVAQTDLFMRRGGNGRRVEIRGSASGSVYWQGAYSGTPVRLPVREMPLVSGARGQGSLPSGNKGLQNPYFNGMGTR